MNSQELNILETLKNIIDPKLNKDIVTLGYVKNIRLVDNKVTVDLVLKTHSNGLLQKAVENHLIGLEHIHAVKVNIIEEKEVSSKANALSLQNVKKIIAVSSCKGGVGKSTICSMIAREFANEGFKVGLVDVDIHGPSIPSLFEIHQPQIKTNESKQLIPIVSNNLKIMSFGFLLGDGPAVMRGPIVTRYVQELLLNTQWGDLDYLFIDMPPGTGDVQLTITQTLNLDGAVIVTTPQTLSLIDVARGIIMFEKVNVPILGIVENMSYYMCEKCGEKHFIFGEHSRFYFEDKFGVPTLAVLPIHKSWTSSVNLMNSDDSTDNLMKNIIERLNQRTNPINGMPEIKYDNKGIKLSFVNQEFLTVEHKTLRLNCPCALCVNEMTGEKILKIDQIREDIAPKSITPLGNYAIAIHWNDNHSSGIYPFKLLKKLAEKSKSSI